MLASTTEVYGSGSVPFQEEQREAPPSPYAISKVAAERILLMQHRATGLPAVIARIATAYGPGQPRHKLIPSIIEAYARGDSPRLSDPAQSRDFVFVDDVVDGLIAAATHEKAHGEIVNIGDVTTYTVQHIAETVRALMRVTIAPEYDDRAQRVNEARVWASSREKAERILGWAPRTSLVNGLDRTIASLRADGRGVAAQSD